MIRTRAAWSIPLMLGALALASPGNALQAPARIQDFVSMRPAAPEEIVVSGRRIGTQQQVEQQARDISLIDGSPLHEPLGRFRTGVCPGIIGLPREMAELVVDRIRYNAERIGADLAPPQECAANMIIAFVRDGRSEVAALMKGKHYLFNQLTKDEGDALLAEEGPVRAWHNVVVRSRFGDEIRGEAVAAHRNLTAPPTLYVANSHSHIFLSHRRDIESAVVVIDVGAIDGLSINQIGDYVTMRGFARTRPASAEAANDTVLSLFEADAKQVAGLTPFDLAYLKTLYRSYDGARALTTLAATGRAIRRGEEGIVLAD